MSSRHGNGEVEQLRAALAAERAERERLADKLAQVLDRVYEMTALPATAGGETGPLPQVQRPQSHRTPKDQRWLRVVPGILLPSGLGGGLRAHRMLVAKVAAAGAVGGVVMTGALGASHHLEYDTPWSAHHWSPAVPGMAPADAVPMPSSSVHLIASSVHAPVKPRVAPAVASSAATVADPVPVPVVTSQPPSQDTSSQDTPAQDTTWDSGTSGSLSQTPLTSQTSRSSDWQARGQHASPLSAPVTSGYVGGHRGSSQDGGWQSGSGQSANWQGGIRQSVGWQGGQQPGGGWQQNGGQQRNHGGR